MGILSMLLGGCGKAPPREDTTALENPPPRPPHCPDLPELKHITLKDGAIADVRIVQFRLRKLYVPADMMREDFVDKMDRFDGFVPRHKLKRFVPDMHSIECPGIVHEFDKTNSIGSALFLRTRDSQRRLFKNMSGRSTLDQIHIFENASYPTEELWQSDTFSGFVGGNIYPFDDIMASYDIPDKYKKGSPQWHEYRNSVIEFTRWLATSPRDRDNDRIFTLGAKSQ